MEMGGNEIDCNGKLNLPQNVLLPPRCTKSSVNYSTKFTAQ